MVSAAPAQTSALTALRVERDRFVALAFCWAELLVELNSESTIVFAAGATEVVLGRAASEIIGRPIDALVIPSDRALIRETLRSAGGCARIADVQVSLLTTSGDPRPVTMAAYRIEDLAGHFFLAFRSSGGGNEPAVDPVTGLLTEEAFVDAVSSALASGSLDAGEEVVLIDARSCAGVRQRLSEQAADELSANIGRFLNAQSGGRGAALLARDVYGLIHRAEVEADTVRQSLSEIIRSTDPDGEAPALRVATVDINVPTIREADIVKGLIYGINCFRSRNDDLSLESLSMRLSDLAQEAVAVVSSFSRMVADRTFNVLFQPILDTKTGQIHHFEALTRLDADLTISPFEQIKFAENTGLIIDLDMAVVCRVLELLKAMRDDDEMCIAVNVSGVSALTPAYFTELEAKLKQNPWTRGRLMFEITESAEIEDLDGANRFIQYLRGLGYKVCLDDFGAGAANFRYLSRLDIDIVKLDGSTLRNAQQSAKGKAFLGALVRLCRDLNVATIAEMVEDENDLALVRDSGVDYVQGYLFGKPGADVVALKQAVPARHFRAESFAPAQKPTRGRVAGDWRAVPIEVVGTRLSR